MGRKRTKEETEKLIEQAKQNFEKWNSNRKDKKLKFGQCKSVGYWFVADDMDVVVSFYKSTEPEYLKIHYTEDGRAYVVSGRGHNSKTHYIHRLQAEAFPKRVYAYGNAKDYESLDGLEVHHTDGRTKNRPECEEILEKKTHSVLFDKRTTPKISDVDSKHFEYMNKVAKIVEENTPEQTVVVFTGSGIVNGVETKEHTQVIYADDMPGVKELEKQALDLKGVFIKYEPETVEDSRLYRQLLLTDDEAEKLEKFVMGIYKRTKEPRFFTSYQGINLMINFIAIK